MLKEYLTSQWQNGKFQNSWLIEGSQLEKIYREIVEFARVQFFNNIQLAADFPDFICIKAEENNNHIFHEQIQNLVKFVMKKSIVAKCRVAIIYQAELMNKFAANTCLKLLEDTPQDCYIFLITANAAKILPTVTSRCQKYSMLSENNYNYEEVAILNKNYNLEDRLKFIKLSSTGTNDIFKKFASNSITLLAKFLKKSVSKNFTLNDAEEQIMSQLKSIDPEILRNKLVYLNKLMQNTIDFDLDRRIAVILIIEEFSN